MSYQAVITGGKGGVGRALSAELSAHGWMVDAPGRAALDVTDPAAVARYFLGREPDLLVCAAGVTRDRLLHGLSPDDWQAVLETNLGGAMRCAKAILPAMLAKRAGHIIFLSSFSALHPPAGQAAYAAAKAALIGFAKSLARETGAHNVRVNCLLPGFLETNMTTAVSPARRAQVLGDHLLGRFNTPNRVAAFIRFLHEEMPHTSGQTFQLDSRIA